MQAAQLTQEGFHPGTAGCSRWRSTADPCCDPPATNPSPVSTSHTAWTFLLPDNYLVPTFATAFSSARQRTTRERLALAEHAALAYEHKHAGSVKSDKLIYRRLASYPSNQGSFDVMKCNEIQRIDNKKLRPDWAQCRPAAETGSAGTALWRPSLLNWLEMMLCRGMAITASLSAHLIKQLKRQR